MKIGQRASPNHIHSKGFGTTSNFYQGSKKSRERENHVNDLRSRHLRTNSFMDKFTNNSKINSHKKQGSLSGIFANNLQSQDILNKDNRNALNNTLQIETGNGSLERSNLNTRSAANSPAHHRKNSHNFNDMRSELPLIFNSPSNTVRGNLESILINKSNNERGFKTPIKKHMPYWDAKSLQDSQNFIKQQEVEKLILKNKKMSYRSFLENQMKQRQQKESDEKEQNKKDFNKMLNNINSIELHDRRAFHQQKKKLNEQNLRMLRQYEKNNEHKRKLKSKDLKEELHNANKAKVQLDSDKMKDYVRKQQLKEQERKDVQRQIDIKKKIKMVNTEGDRKEMDHMLKHEFDLFGRNQIRHQNKISNIMNRNERILHENTKYSNFKQINSAKNSTFNESNSLLLTQNAKDLTQRERNLKCREMLQTYKQQIIENEKRKKKSLNNKKKVERFIFDKDSEIVTHQVKEERLQDLKKKAQLRKELDRQIRDKKKAEQEELLSVYI
ncbi:unnamed protein product [Moneuplotes crassus]|uniref:Uncharacterized protein n=1 Tax=Euplotes crassus TaxID=5936 RepID=A0AAD1UCH8_EUPCR|nr:unnamed protein product [Moneuplotes crassus]